MTTPTRKIIVFLVLTFGFSSVFYVLMSLAGTTGAAGGIYVFGFMWCPGGAALITRFVFDRNLRGLGWRWPARTFLALGYLLPIAYGLLTYAVIWLTGLGGFSPAQLAASVSSQIGYQPDSPELFDAIYVLVAATLLMIPSILAALGEEIGWRGLLVPELARTTTFARTAIISGAIWAAWHLPLILFTDYNNGAASGFALLCFVGMVLGLSFAFAWLRLASGSIWPAVLLHASHNIFIKNVFTPLTSNTGPTAYVVDEFGIGLVIVLGLLALLVWQRRDRMPSLRPAPAS